MEKIDRACEEALEVIDRLGDPKNMSKREWIEFLGSLISDLAIRKEAAQEELEEQGG